MILAVCQTRSLRSPSNLFLVNLAVSDLLLVSLACPATLAQLAASSWPLPPVPELCRCYVSRVTCHVYNVLFQARHLPPTSFLFRLRFQEIVQYTLCSQFRCRGAAEFCKPVRKHSFMFGN